MMTANKSSHPRQALTFSVDRFCRVQTHLRVVVAVVTRLYTQSDRDKNGRESQGLMSVQVAVGFILGRDENQSTPVRHERRTGRVPHVIDWTMHGWKGLGEMSS